MHVQGPHIGGRGDGATEHPPLGHRIQVLLHRRRLDEELAGGATVASSSDRELRAEQLEDPRARRRLATALRRIVAEARDPRPSLLAGIPPARCAVLPWSEGLLGLAERIERSGPVATRGLAELTLLLSDGAGPLFHNGAEQPLGEAIWSIADGLQPCSRHQSPSRVPRGGRSQCCPVCGAVDGSAGRGRTDRRRR